jgi:two-component system sensor histidine kinase YesM
MYYFISYSISHRIIGLANHMKVNRRKNKPFIEGKNKEDEIGFLVESYNQMINENEELVEKVYRSEMLKKEAEYSALYAQVRPHFICNVLGNIKMLAEKNNDQQVADMSFKFSMLIRYSINHRTDVTLYEEIENIKYYLDIQKIRFGPRFDYRVEVDGDLEDYMCPWFLIQPIVENSIIHGVNKMRKNGVINVKIKEYENYFEVVVSDNGVGINDKKIREINKIIDNYSLDNIILNSSKSIGVLNVYGRLVEYYGSNSKLIIESEKGNGTKVKMRLGKKRQVDEDKNINC